MQPSLIYIVRISYTTALRCIWILDALKSIYTEAPWYKWYILRLSASRLLFKRRASSRTTALKSGCQVLLNSQVLWSYCLTLSHWSNTLRGQLSDWGFCDVLGLRGFFALATRLSVLLETVRSHCCCDFQCPCVRISARACCFSFVHCAGRVHGLSSSATERRTLLACVHWLQHDGGKYSRFQCFAGSPKATQSWSWLQVAAFVRMCFGVIWHLRCYQ